MNDFHIYEEIGQGRHSTVYKGRKKASITYVAIKSVDKKQMDKVLREVKIIYRLKHANILRFHNWYETRNHLWLILEYCTGGDLLHVLTQDRQLPESTVKVLGVDLLSGLRK
jgi:serine/threonine-protein kinase ULK4